MVDIASLVRPNILSLEPYHCAREKVLEGVLLDANENPFRQEWEGVLLNRYPDPHQRELRAAIAADIGVRSEQIAAGVGSDEVLEWIFKVFCRPGVDTVVTAEPTYGMYRVTARIFDVACRSFRLGPRFEFDAGEFLASASNSAKALFVCSPNNPTGNLLDPEQILEVCRAWNGIVALDEAYADFAEAPSLAGRAAEHPNLIVLRTLSKAYGRAAVRLGYAVATPEIISYFMKVKTPYNLSAVTMEIGRRTLLASAVKTDHVNRIRQERAILSRNLSQVQGVREVFPSQANFLLFRCARASEVVDRLFEKGIVVRDRSSMPGLEDCIRVTVGVPAENQLFLRELQRVLEEIEQ